jgi:deoxycytidylate deaminase
MNSKPCSMCCEIIKASGIKTVMYSDDDGSIIRLKSWELDESHVSKGVKVMQEMAGDYFRKGFAKIKRSVGYGRRSSR